MNYEQATEKLKAYGQLHILNYYEELDAIQREQLLAQIDATDFTILENCKDGKIQIPKGEISPLQALEIAQIKEKEAEYTKIGFSAIRAGKVGAVLLAGGMGTRLGSDDPKGMYNIGLTRDVFIFQRLIENLMEVTRQADVWIPLYVMTSEKNHEKTTSFFAEHNYFGYPSEYIFFFRQEMAPAIDYEGKIFMEEKYRMSTSPNGNGGWFISMDRAGILDRIHADGVEWLNVFSVDNVLQRIADPCFVGATICAHAQVGSKVVRKKNRDEKVGVMCLENGKPSIVEYYELTEEMLDAKDEKGDPAYNFGVILNYLFRVDALEGIMEKKLPLHMVEKKIPYLDEKGVLQKPENPNGYKFEQLVLDMIHELDCCLPYEVVREYEFAPIKNKTGADSVDSARELCARNGIEL